MIDDFIRVVAEVCFNTQPEYSTKDIYKRIKESCESDKITKCVLKEMFCESTGTHFLDSGGAYGRGWQRCQSVKDQDWDKLPWTKVEVTSKDDFYVVKNTYQFLSDKLTYNVELDKIFHEFCNNEKRSSESWFSNVDDFCKHQEEWDILLEDCVDEVEHIGGHNTYNGNSCLDSTLQWDSFRIGSGKHGGEYMILQTHNGCDVRGGYSTPHIFSFDFDDFWSEIDGLSARCKNHDKETTITPGVQLDLNGNHIKDPIVDLYHVDCYSDDTGCHWYTDGGEEIDSGAECVEDEDGDTKLVCKKCGGDIEFW